mgnify:CR=1 FL=1
MPTKRLTYDILCRACERALSRAQWRWHRHNPNSLSHPAVLLDVLFVPLRYILSVRTLKATATTLCILYIALVAVHLTNGFPLFGSLVHPPLRDLRALATCPHKPQAVWRFVDRGPLGPGVAAITGITEMVPPGQQFYREICQGKGKR